MQIGLSLNMTPSQHLMRSYPLYPEELSAFFRSQAPKFEMHEACLWVGLRLAGGYAQTWHGKRPPAEPIPLRTVQQWLLPLT